VDLAANLWRNEDEVAGNGRDDDGNGYVDDVHGWSFIGGPTGDVHHDTFEVTRLYAQCVTAAARDTLPAAVRDECPKILADYDRRRTEAENTLRQIGLIGEALGRAVAVLEREAGTDSLTVAQVRAMMPRSGDARQARQLYLQLADDGLTPEELEEARVAYEGQLRYGYNTSFDPRNLVADAGKPRAYGNANVMGPDADHGTHVAGIIGAVRNAVGVDGVAPQVRLMILRAVPDGDERDKDVANAIRYAVDNGARVINMSFGKAYSPQKALVDAAVRYADSAGVLLVHAAGNDAANVDSVPNFPNARYAAGGAAANWIEVGASSWRGLDSLAAPFTNYGRTTVDLFAPGVDVRSTVPDGGYEPESGTSMAAPVVTGVAALLMSYYPTLTAADVKRILVESATRRPQQTVVKPGSSPMRAETVRFGELSATGGVVNVYEALRMAADRTTPRP
jgi:subtilisin family serine protease